MGRLSEEKVFKDPVHRYVHVREELIWKLIDTAEFQRLNRIRQLGTSYTTFHGAEHSRFNHSLGVYEIMRRILEKFSGRREWNEEETLLCLVAALLHDVGHGPFSHAFEYVFGTDHEAWTRRIILGDTQINRVLRTEAEDFPQRVADVIHKTYPNKLVVSMISSQIDADRMDYLLRDAYYTGTNYGNFDMERILRVMRPSRDYVVIKYSGMHAVEDYILSRYQMYWQVYFHPVSRSAEMILSRVFKRAKSLYENGYRFQHPPSHFIPFFDGRITLNDYLALDEAIVFYYLQTWKNERDPILSDLSDRFINRRLFKYVSYTPNAQMEEQLRSRFRQIGVDPDYYLVPDSPSDLPYDFYRPGKEGRLPIYLLMPNGKHVELSQVSEIVDAITGKERYDHKIYFPLDFLEDPEKDPKVVTEIKDLLFGNKIWFEL